MPYKFETQKLKIKREDDRRVKLTDKERELIKFLYGKISQRKLAKRFNVSRRLIVFIGDPEKYKRNLELKKLRGGSKIYYKKEKNTITIQRHRAYKQDLNKQGKLIKNKK